MGDDGSQDTVPFQKIYERFRHPECHEYLFERDGMSATVDQQRVLEEVYVQAFDMYDKLVLDRRPGVIRAPFARSGDGCRVGSPPTWLPTRRPTTSTSTARRSPTAHRVPGARRARRVETAGVAKIGSTLRVDKGDCTETWSRFNPTTDTGVSTCGCVTSAPLPLYNGAPIGSKPECECDAMSSREYVVSPQDSRHTRSASRSRRRTPRTRPRASYTNSLTVENVTGANLGGRNLSGMDFSGLDLTGTNLRGANLAGANFMNATLTNANLQGANLTVPTWPAPARRGRTSRART